MFRAPLLMAARSTRLRELVERSRLSRPVVARFIAGRNRDEVLRSTELMLKGGLLVSLDHLGEDTTNAAQAGQLTASYVDILDAISECGFGAQAEVSIKLSAIGLALPHGATIAMRNTGIVCAAAQRAGTTVTIDAEDHATTDAGLELVRELRVEFPWVGTVLQAYLRRTEEDCRALADAGSRVRLCKGAYREPASVAFQDKGEVSASYRRCLDVLMGGAGYPMVATHDPAMITHALLAATRNGRGVDDYELQMLYGIRVDEQRRLADAGQHVRVYLAYGDEWYGYFMRRLAERPANLRFFLRALVTPG
ncbi:L-proline dehydrogenase [Antricoccus suffuscus]|uniref:proline dehydrogenase n=1 Tax=Antricoccus suffuscus TaxID=1629062 RepID=A0A2T1A6Z6_9ACTN|nr:proline dehydrogenase family protein [Antricoccus suffuscus]PRZ44098.1 L-proline dehydrogenase [Antricoccus suffuscus]